MYNLVRTSNLLVWAFIDYAAVPAKASGLLISNIYILLNGCCEFPDVVFFFFFSIYLFVFVGSFFSRGAWGHGGGVEAVVVL